MVSIIIIADFLHLSTMVNNLKTLIIILKIGIAHLCISKI